MIKKLKAFTLHVIAGANVATIIMMLLVGYSDHLNPSSFPMLSNAGLVFPVFLVLNMAFLVFWLIFKARWALIPFVGFLVCYGPVRRYCPMNIPQDPPRDAIKVMSYNVWYFAGWEDHGNPSNPILEYIAEQEADIVCLQESATNEVKQNKVDSILNPIYPHRDTLRMNQGECITLFSKFPIVSKARIPYESKGNISAAFRVKIDGQEVLVVNNHLETTGLTLEEKTRFMTMVNGEMKVDTAEETSRLLVHKLGKATAIRARQAEAVSRYIAAQGDMPVIVCGDFNDGPISYARRTIARGLTDCYVETGNGPGISYHHNAFFVRIDHIFCSAHFEPVACRVDDKIKSSDHYPVIAWLKMRPKR